MEGINKIFCGTDVQNTGICECFFDPSLIDGAIAVPLRRVFTNEELLDANIADTINSAILAAKASRIFPWAKFVDITDNTEDDTVQTFGYGGTRRVREGNYNWFFPFTAGGVNLSNALRSFNGLTGKYGFIFIISSQNTLIGTSKKDVNGNWGMGPITMEDFKTQSWRPATGSTVAAFGTNFSFKPDQINEKIAFKKVSLDSLSLYDLVGLETIKLTLVEFAGNLATVTAESDCGSTDIYDLYADEFAQTVAWSVVDEDGVDKPIASVVKNAAAKGWDIQLTSGVFEDGDVISNAAPAVLAAPPINVVGYESDTVTVEEGSS